MPSTTSQLSIVQSIHSSCGNIFSGQQRQRATIPKIPRYIAIGGILLLILLALSIAIACIDASNIITFRACFGTLIGLLGILQLCVAVKLISNSCNPLLELSQPIPISILAIAGAVATWTCYAFALPEYNVSCAIRQPIIFICIQIMGEAVCYVEIALGN